MTNQDDMTTAQVTVTITDPTRAVLTQGGQDDEHVAAHAPHELRAAIIARLLQRAVQQRQALTVTLRNRLTGQDESLTADPRGNVTSAGAPAPSPDSNGARRAEPRRTHATVLDRLTGLSTSAKALIAVSLLLLLSLLVALPLLLSGKDEPSAAPSPSDSAAGATALPDGCLGGTDVIAGARAAGPLATTSTIVQGGITAPSPSGAAAAAAAYARLRSTLPAPAGRDQVIASILAPDATPAARQAVPAAPGWSTHLDMTKARWQIVSGDGRTAGVDLLLTSVGAQNGKAAAPAQLAVHLDLVAVSGQWRLKNVGAPTNTAQLASAHTFQNAQVCS